MATSKSRSEALLEICCGLLVVFRWFPRGGCWSSRCFLMFDGWSGDVHMKQFASFDLNIKQSYQNVCLTIDITSSSSVFKAVKTGEMIQSPSTRPLGGTNQIITYLSKLPLPPSEEKQVMAPVWRWSRLPATV